MAKQVSLVAVRVLSCEGSGMVSGVIAGIDWVTSHHLEAVAMAGQPVPAVANMSLGGGASGSLDLAVTGSVDAGVAYAVAAGNAYGDACAYSPARAPRAITVAAIGQGTDPLGDVVPTWSNQGECVDILAPGVAITSDYITSASGTHTMSGTSMAAPHVTGALAQWFGLHPLATPELAAQALVGNGTLGRVSGLAPTTPNVLLFTGFIAEDPWDTTPPVATLTAPAPGATVTGESVEFAAVAQDDVGVVQVAFSVDDKVVARAASAPFTATWDSTTVANGRHRVVATAYDLHGNVGSSTPAVEITTDNIVYFNLHVSMQGTGSGHVAGPGIDCTTGEEVGCTSRLQAGTTIHLAASADDASLFVGWAGACSGSGDCDVTLSDHTAVAAVFQPRICNLSVQVRGSGTGTVTGAGLSCSTGGTAGCTVQVANGTLVQLHAAPGGESQFGGWTGGWCAGTGECEFAVTEHTTVVASFAAEWFHLTVTLLGAGGGTVAGVPGLACISSGGVTSPGSTCDVKVANGATVTPTATPDTVSFFGGWGTTCTGVAGCTLLMNSAKSLMARLEPSYLPLTVTTKGEGTVHATGPELDMDCPANSTRTAQVENGGAVTLTATAAPDWIFASWTGGACSGNAPCAVAMTGSRSVTANFQPSRYRLTVALVGTGTGTVEGLPGGATCGKPVREASAECVVDVDNGATVALAATAGDGSIIAGWTGCTAGPAGCEVKMTAPKTVTVTYQPSQYRLTVSMGGAGQGKVTGAKLDCGLGASICSVLVDNGATASLVATPDGNSVFGTWGIVCTGSGACNVRMNSDKTVWARFDPGSYPLTVAVTGTGSVSGPGIDCGVGASGDCTESVTYGASVTLAARPGPEAIFAGWSGACSDTAACTVTMAEARSVTALFQPATYPLTIGFAGAGTGLVSGDRLSCPSDAPCTFAIPNGETRVLSASGSNGSVVGTWSGCTVVAGGCSVTMTGPRSVTVAFHPPEVLLTVSLAGSGTGSVSGERIACGLGGTACTATVPTGSTRVLTSSAGPGSVFAGWSGGCSGTGACTVVVSELLSVTATFQSNTYPLLVSLIGSASGSVTGTGVSCSGPPGTNCSVDLARNSTVVLTAAGTGGGTFTGWSGACTGTGSCSVTMSAAKGVAATFQPPGYTLKVRLGGAGTGKVTGGGLLDCGDGGSTCSATFAPGTVVSLAQVPGANSTFTGWGIVCTGTGPCNVKMNSSKTVSATFQPSTYRVTVTVVGNGTVTGPELACSGGTCFVDRPYGSAMSLTATPGDGSSFLKWTGNCRGAAPTCNLTMTSAWSTSATFTTP
jgi:hypothetical protein